MTLLPNVQLWIRDKRGGISHDLSVEVNTHLLEGRHQPVYHGTSTLRQRGYHEMGNKNTSEHRFCLASACQGGMGILRYERT